MGRITGKNKDMGNQDLSLEEACLYLSQKLGKTRPTGKTTFYRYLIAQPGRVKVYKSKYNRKKSYFKRNELDLFLQLLTNW